jgi:hypothetical protein
MSSAPTLSPKILEHLQRLGARLNESKRRDQELIDGKPIPAALSLLLACDWPKKKKFFTDANNHRSFPARFVELNLFDTLIKEDRRYVIFGSCGGGNYWLAISLDDSSPSDPYVHKLDSEDGSGSDGAELSLFLEDLREQTKYSDGT